MQRYLCVFFGVVLTVMALAALCNVLVDPYQMSGVRLLERFTAIKPYFGDNHVLGKPFVIRRRQPQALIFGTSRENHGIDPDHAGWSVGSQQVYNLALDAANMADIEHLFEHARHVTTLQEVVIALDFLNMFDGNVSGAANFDTSLLVSEHHSAPATWFSAARYFVSWPMLRDSVRTLLQQDALRSEFESNGRRNARVFESAARRFGQHHMFEYSEIKYLRARLPLPPARRYQPQDADGPTLEHLAHILDRAATEHIRVRLYITPVHARQLEVYRALGLWDALETWKRQVRATARGEHLRKTSQSFEVWDFADYSSLTTETVPDASDRQGRMQWYWESSHYRKPLGDRVLDRVFAQPGGRAPADFGLLLNRLSDTEFDEYLQQIQARGATYRASHPGDVADLARLAAEAGGS